MKPATHFGVCRSTTCGSNKSDATAGPVGQVRKRERTGPTGLSRAKPRASRPVGISILCVVALFAASTEAAPPDASTSPDPSAAAVSRDAAIVGPDERRVSLQQILKYALDHAPVVAMGRAGVKAGQAEVDAESPLFPSDPIVSGSIGRRQTAGGSGIDYGVSLEQEIDVFGKRAARLDAAREEKTARQVELEAAFWVVHLEVHAAYRRGIVARERALAAERILAFARRLVEITRKRFAAGETSPLPVRLAEGELAQAKQAALSASYEYRAARLELARAAGWTYPALLTPAGNLDAPRFPPAAAALIQLARTRQPVLRAARARVRAAEAQLGAAKRGGWPNPTVGIAYESESEPGASPARVSIVTGSLSIPLPVWVGSTPERARANASLERAKVERASLDATLAVQIVQAQARVETNAKRAQLYGTQILPTLEDNLKLINKSFDLGEIDILDVMVARERFLRTQQEALQAFTDYYEAWEELEAAVGAKFDDAPDGGGPVPKQQETKR